MLSTLPSRHLKNPWFQARGFFSSRGLSPAWASNVLSDASQEAVNRAALFLWRQPSHSHGTFDDVPLNPVASWAAKRSQVVAQRARLNRRQFHWRTASHALRALILCVEHMCSPATLGGSATELSVTENCRGRVGDGTNMPRRKANLLVNIAHIPKELSG
jgi:hypothetical protein